MDKGKAYMGVLFIAGFTDFRLAGEDRDFFIDRRNEVADLFGCLLFLQVCYIRFEG
jgi:hypothetical protein